MAELDVAGLILAGGRSSRMGGHDKAFVTLAQKPLMSHAIARLSKQCRAMAINSNADPDAFASFGLPILGDQPPDYSGPLAGVLAGLDWAAQQGHSHILSVAVDTPFFPDTLRIRLQEAMGASGLSLAATRGADGTWRHPTFGLWPVALREDLRCCLSDGMRKIVLWTDRHAPGSAVFEVTGHDPFFNINTPDDLRHAEDLMGANTWG